MRIILTRYILFFASNMFFLLQADAQLSALSVFKLEKENRHIKINCLFKNNDGYIFTGTDNGLYKFDGEKYSRIDFDNADYTDTVTAIFQDKQQKIWVGFNNGRIANIINKKLQYFNPEEGTPQKKITAFLQDKEDNIWFSTNGEGIYFIRNSKMYLVNKEEGLSDLHVSSLFLADNGDVLAGTDQGINICSIREGKTKVTVMGPRQGLPDYIVTSIIASTGSLIWVGLQDKGFCLFDYRSGKIMVPSVAREWKYGQVNAMLQAQGVLWLATADSGLCKYWISSQRFSKVDDFLNGYNINNILEDKQGNIWLAYPGYGLLRMPGETLKLLQVPGNPVFEHIHAVLCDKDGNIWLNDEANHLIKLVMKSGYAEPKRINLTGVDERTDITALYQDTVGNIWVGTMGRGLFIVDPVSLKFRPFTENSLFINAGVLSISGKGNKLYASSLQGSMQVEIRNGNKNINSEHHFMNYDSESTGTNYVYSIFEDSRKRIWFATDGKGLTMLTEKGFTYYNNKSQIKDDRIYSLTEDRKGNIWFSTANAGIYKFDGKNFENFSVKQGLIDNNISVLKTDRAGNIIAVHNKGLDIIDPLTGNISYVRNSMGIQEINAEDLGAVTKDTAGNVMVSTRGGILTYTFPINSLQKPTAIIESIQLFLNDIDDNASNIFSHDENNFTFSYTGLYYTDPARLFYQYKLEGLDSSWILTRDRSKNFPKLAPGKYTFRIQASLNRNFKNAGESVYNFTIRQAFYKTYWFIAACILLLGSLIYLYFRNREISLKRNERLRSENIQFQFEVLRSQVNPHFLFNSFNTLISTIEEEPGRAVEYAEQLSEFFRNVVIQRDKEVISLKDELEALSSYSFLQQKRYGDHLKVETDITSTQKELFLIPPLTLQLLLENAIKHNAVSKETPLAIKLQINVEDYLTISNNINPRMTNEKSTGMGLQNIISRFELLTKKKVIITNNGKHFTVSIPLLK